jgi:hypothetical protein
MTLTGVKPWGLMQYRFENFYVYGAIEPTTGESFFLELPCLNTVNFPNFLHVFAPHDQATLSVVLIDNDVDSRDHVNRLFRSHHIYSGVVVRLIRRL